MPRTLIVASLLCVFASNVARADDRERTSLTIGAALTFRRAPTLTEGSSSSPAGCDFICFRSIDRYLGLIERGAAVRLEYRERRSRVAGVRFTGWLGAAAGTWVEMTFESGLLSFGGGERLDRRDLLTTAMVDAALALGPVFFAGRTAFGPALAWQGSWRVGGPERTAEAPEGYALPRRVHALGLDLMVAQEVSARASLVVSFRIAVPTGRKCPTCPSYGVNLGAVFDLLGDG